MTYTEEAGNGYVLKTWDDQYGQVHAIAVCPVCLREFPETRCDYCHGMACSGCLTALDVQPPILCCENCLDDMPGYRKVHGKSEAEADAA